MLRGQRGLFLRERGGTARDAGTRSPPAGRLFRLVLPVCDAANEFANSIGCYSYPDYPFATVYPHDLVDEVTRGLGARWIVVSSDTREVVAGIVSLGAESRAAWTSHPGLVVPTTELVKHDIYVQEMLDAHRDVLEATFGPGLVNLRDRLKALESLGGLVEKP